MNERFVFIPSIGFCLLMTWVVKDKIPQWLNASTGKMVGMGIVALLLAGFTWKTIDRVPDWKNRLTLNVSGAAASTNSARANLFLGTAIFEEEYRNETDRNRQQELIKEVAYFIDRSLSIHPNYGSALKMHSGVVAEEYKFDRDLDKLLAEFHNILQRKSHEPFVDQYTEYLIGRSDNQKLEAFCYKVGYEHFTQVRRDYSKAVQYLNYGLEASPNSPNLINGIAQTYQLMGDNQKANNYLARLRK